MLLAPLVEVLEAPMMNAEAASMGPSSPAWTGAFSRPAAASAPATLSGLVTSGASPRVGPWRILSPSSHVVSGS